MAKRGSNIRNSIKTALEEINLIDDEKREQKFRELTSNHSGSIGRHAFKKYTTQAGNFIFSIRSMKETLEKCQRVGAFIKENYGLNRLERVEEHHLISFLDDLKQKGRTPKTIDSYKHALIKLSKGTQAKWGYSIVTDAVKNYDIGGSVNAIRERMWTNEQVIQIADNLRGKYNIDVQIMLRVGVRVHELYGIKGMHITLESNERVFTPKDGEVDKAFTLRVKGKGGKVSYRPILPEHVDFFRELKERFGDNERITKSPKDEKKARNAIGSAIRRTSLKLFGEELSSARCHEFRKCFADTLWTRMREEGYSKEDRVTYVLGRCLSHGHSRNELIHNYIRRGNKD